MFTRMCIFYRLILYIWFSFVSCHSIAIIIDISSHVVWNERRKKKTDQYMKQNKHNNLYGCVFYFKWQTYEEGRCFFRSSRGQTLTTLTSTLMIFGFGLYMTHFRQTCWATGSTVSIALFKSQRDSLWGSSLQEQVEPELTVLLVWLGRSHHGLFEGYSTLWEDMKCANLY